MEKLLDIFYLLMMVKSQFEPTRSTQQTLVTDSSALALNALLYCATGQTFPGTGQRYIYIYIHVWHIFHSVICQIVLTLLVNISLTTI